MATRIDHGDASDDGGGHQGLPCGRSRAGRVGAARDRDRRIRDAGAHGGPRRIRQAPTAEGRAHRRLDPHDHPDCGADRDAPGARGGRALGIVQHLFDPGPCGRGDRRRRHAGVRLQGRKPRGILGVHPSHLRVGGRRHAEHDFGRRRRCDPPGPSRQTRGDRSVGAGAPAKRGRGSPVRRDQTAPRQQAGLVRATRREHPRRDRGDHHRLASPVPDGQAGPPLVPAINVNDWSPSRSSTTSTAAARAWSTASGARPT